MSTPPSAHPPAPPDVLLAPDEPAAIVGELDVTERGFVLGALLGGGDDGRGATTTTALESPSRERCAEALVAIGRLARTERVRLTRALAKDVVPTFPAGLEAVDPAYLQAILDEEAPAIVSLVGREAPAALKAAVTRSLASRSAAGAPAADSQRNGGGNTEPDDGDDDDDTDVDTEPDADPEPGADRERNRRGDEGATAPPATIVMTAAASDGSTVPPDASEVSPDLLAELQRAVLSSVVAVPPAPAGAAPRSWARRLVVLPASEAVAHLAWQGAQVLGLSLQGSAGEVLLRVAALIGPPFADGILAAGRRARGTDPDLGLDRAAARTVVAATRPALDPRETLARVGARAVGARLTSHSERGLGGIETMAALAQRLPPGIAAELRAAAGATGPAPGG